MISKQVLWIVTIFTSLIVGSAIWFFLLFHVSLPVLLQSCNAAGSAITNFELLLRISLSAILIILPLLFRGKIAHIIELKWPKYESLFNIQSLIDAIFAFTFFITLFLLLEHYYLSDAIIDYASGVEIDRNAISSCWLQRV